MFKYIIKRIITVIPVIIGVTVLVFMIMQLAPGDPAEIILGEQATRESISELRNEMGLDDPAIVRYFRYMMGFLKGDFGISYITKRPVADEVLKKFPFSIKLSFLATTIVILFSIPMGILAAVQKNTFFDRFTMVISLLGVSMPIFWLGLLLTLQFSLKLGWFPVSGAETWKSYVLPSICLAFMNMATIARTTRASMLDTIGQDYIRTARSKGLAYKDVIRKHALRNAMIPTITIVGLQIGGLIGGAVITETVFAWPGIGRLMVQSINNRDTPMVLGCITIIAITFSILNLVVDLLYGVVDVRVRSMYK